MSMQAVQYDEPEELIHVDPFADVALRARLFTRVRDLIHSHNIRALGLSPYAALWSEYQRLIVVASLGEDLAPLDRVVAPPRGMSARGMELASVVTAVQDAMDELFAGSLPELPAQSTAN